MFSYCIKNEGLLKVVFGRVCYSSDNVSETV